MPNKVKTDFRKLHCGQPMDTWRNSKWHQPWKGLANFRFWICLKCGHEEQQLLTPNQKRK